LACVCVKESVWFYKKKERVNETNRMLRKLVININLLLKKKEVSV
jgi:hypothetical protein